MSYVARVSETILRSGSGHALFSIVRRHAPIEAARDEAREWGIEVVVPSPESLPWEPQVLPSTDVCS